MVLKEFGDLPKEVEVYGKKIGEGHPAYIIAEIGNNHNGSLELAKKSVIAAHMAGADAVKFQKRSLEDVFTKELLNQPQTSSRALGTTYGEYRASLELDEKKLERIKNLAHQLGMAFFATPFDLKSVEILSNLGMDAWKVASFDATHSALLTAVAKKGQPIFISTGMSTLEERDEAVKTILKYNKNLIIKHCVSVYPTPAEDLNIGAVATLKERYAPLPVGYSGHEVGFIPTVAAVAIGANSVERHFTIDKSLPGPDHATVSLDALEFAQMVREIRRVEAGVADKKIYLHDGEIKHRQKHSKSIVAKIAIPAGAVISENMIAFKSTGKGGIKPTLAHTVVGRKAKINLELDSVILEEHLS